MTIGQFLLQLASDPELLRVYADRPEEVMREAGLDERQIELLRVADLRDLRLKIESEFQVGEEKVAIQTVCLPTICAPTPPPPPKD